MRHTGFRTGSDTAGHSAGMRTLMFVCAVFMFMPLVTQAAARESALNGTWIINHEMTEAVAPDFKDSGLFDNFGGGRATISVMGVPLPRNEPAQRTSVGSPRDPDVLSCLEMILHDNGEKLVATYQEVGEETFVRGEFRGRNSRWNHKSLQQTYKTTERKVTKTYEVRSDGRLLVTVVVKPRKDKKRVYKRVFERATGEPKDPGDADDKSTNANTGAQEDTTTPART